MFNIATTSSFPQVQTFSLVPVGTPPATTNSISRSTLFCVTPPGDGGGGQQRSFAFGGIPVCQTQPQQLGIQFQPQAPAVNNFLPSYQQMTFVPQTQLQQAIVQQTPALSLVPQHQPQYQVIQALQQPPTFLVQTPTPTMHPFYVAPRQHEPISFGRGTSTETLNPFFTWDRQPGSSTYFPTGFNSDHLASTLMRAPGDEVLENMRNRWLTQRELERVYTEIQCLKAQWNLRTYIESNNEATRSPYVNDTTPPSYSYTNRNSEQERRSQYEGMRNLGRPQITGQVSSDTLHRSPPRADPPYARNLSPPRYQRPRVSGDGDSIRGYRSGSIYGVGMEDEDGDAPMHRQRLSGKSGVTLTKAKHYCIPSVPALEDMTDSNGDCFVTNFKVGHEEFGEVTFPERINVSGLDLDYVVHFYHGVVVLYPGPKPSYGEGLRRRGIATLNNVFPRDPFLPSVQVRDVDRIQELRFEDKLEQHFKQQAGTKFISYDPSSGTLTVAIQTE